MKRYWIVCAVALLTLLAFSAARAEAVFAAPGETGVLEVDNESLSQAYIDRLFRSASGRGVLRAPRPTGTSLEGVEGRLYSLMLPAIVETAAGERTSTEYLFPIEEVFGKSVFTAEDLGVASIIVTDENGNYIINPDADSALNALLTIDDSAVVHALLQDRPYEMYWFGNTYGATGYSYSASFTEITVEGETGIALKVAEEFRLNGNEYAVNPTFGASAASAAVNAQQIVDQYSSYGDYDMLLAFKNEICALTSYNHTAVNEGLPYGNPWQLVWVFDGNPDTKVVCEGYSKAFKYLVDQSPTSATCLLASGVMDGGTGSGRHMWDVVRLEGRNYLVDVTNCDEGSIGNPDALFMKGYARIEADFYVYAANSREVWYRYGDNPTLSAEDMELSHLSYGEACPQHVMETVSEVPATCVEVGSVTLRCAYCGETATEELPMLEHDWAEWTTVEAPTCTEAGLMIHTCQLCGASEELPVDPIGHQWEVVSRTEPTCTEDGSEFRTCAVCGEEAAEALPMLGHDWEIVQTEPTCKEDGSVVRTCARCGEEETEEVLPKLGHDWTEWTVMLEPTCTRYGYSRRVCQRCDKHEELITPPLDHTWTIASQTEPSCMEPGVIVRVCEVCGATEEEELPAIGEHNWDAWVTERMATCTTPGREVRWCKRCGQEEWRETGLGSHRYGQAAWEGAFKVRHCTVCGAPEIVDVFDNGGVLQLPEALTEIEAEAFMGMDAARVRIGGQCASIGERAFAGCANLLVVEIPDSVTEIGEGAFEGYVTLLAESSSAASDYANAHGLNCVSPDHVHEAVVGESGSCYCRHCYIPMQGSGE